MKTGLIHDPIYLKHEMGSHPENAQRLEETINLLGESGLLDKLTSISPRAATIDELTLVHSESHINRVESASAGGGKWLDGDTYASPDSFNVALHAAGGTLRGIDAVISGEVNNAFALVRPPGHHATPHEAMGFCLFNNIAIAARYAQRNHELEKILIVDFDVHHGNGTEVAFYNDPNVLYFSTHQSPHYPGTGAINTDGAEEGKGATVNVPLPAYCGDLEYQRAYEEILAPVARRFKPQLILVSAGYDNHWADPLSMMQLTVDGFANIVRIIKELAGELCEGKLLFTLEGGYHLKALSYSIKATLEVLLDIPRSEDLLGKPQSSYNPRDIDNVIDMVATKHGLK